VVKQPGDSQFWFGLIEVKDYFLGGAKFEFKNVEHVRFWENRWIGQEPLM
jgi:hypothetical protein